MDKQIIFDLIAIKFLPTINTMKQLGPDEIRQQLLQQCVISSPDLLCPSNKKATHFCINPACQLVSPCCTQQQCSSCTKHQQTYCSTIKLSIFAKMFQYRNQSKNLLLKQMAQIQNKMMQQIQRKRNLIEKSSVFSFGFNQEEAKIIELIFSKQVKNVNIKGREVACIYKKIDLIKNQFNNKQEVLMKYFAGQITKIEKILSDLEFKIVARLFTTLKFQSKIISLDRKEDLKFMQQSLNWPQKYQLLYRASENGFLATQFHRKCDNISHTFTIIKSDSGKTFAGYTPSKWESPQTWKYVQDQKCESFLLSFDVYQKIKLKQKQKKYSIRCQKDSGPTFGSGDVSISDNCYQKVSSSRFPDSYNCSQIYKDQKQSRKELFGCRTVYYSSSPTQFNVVQYQVYKLVW